MLRRNPPRFGFFIIPSAITTNRHHHQWLLHQRYSSSSPSMRSSATSSTSSSPTHHLMTTNPLCFSSTRMCSSSNHNPSTTTNNDKKNHNDMKPRVMPVVLNDSMPRQGKTLFGDQLGSCKAFYGQLSGGTATAENTFIFNMTLNANWSPRGASVSHAALQSTKRRIKELVERITSLELEKLPPTASEEDKSNVKNKVQRSYNITSDCRKEALARAETELCRRVVGAATGAITEDSYREEICEPFIDACDCDFRKTCERIQDMVAKKRNEDLTAETSNFVLIFDEVTSLEDKMFADPVHLYASLASVSAPNCVVVLSGFRDISGDIAVSGYETVSIDFPPITSSQSRRELNTMKTVYFNTLMLNKAQGKRAHMGDALYYYELVKSSPGMSGTLVENMGRWFQDHEFGTEAVGSIPMVRFLTRGNSADTSRGMLDVLRLKSMFFLSSPEEETDRSSSSENTTPQRSVSDVCNRKINQVLRSAAVAKAVETSLSGNGVKDLLFSRAEPLFVSKCPATQNNNEMQFTQYFEKLHNHCVNLCSNERVVSSLVELVRVLRGGSERDIKRIELFNKNIRKEGSAAALIPRSAVERVFYEYGVATGLLIQRKFRRETMAVAVADADAFVSPDELRKNTRTTLSQYLHGSRVVYSLQRDENIPRAFHLRSSFPKGEIVWWGNKTSKTSKNNNKKKCNRDDGAISCKLVEFDGEDYPAVQLPSLTTPEKKNKKNKIDENDDDASHQPPDWSTCEDILIPCSFDRKGSTHHMRRSKYNNTTTETFTNIIVNERFDDSLHKEEQETDDVDDLVQFWIDTKHDDHNAKPHFMDQLSSVLKNEKTSVLFSKVRHIVHVIVTPFDHEDAAFQQLEKVLIRSAGHKSMFPLSNSEDARQLKSYTLCFVSPDDLSEKKAFENLVSQPIALTLPLTEQQMKESWTRPLPSAASRKPWWNYVATAGSESLMLQRFNLRKEKLLIELESNRKKNNSNKKTTKKKNNSSFGENAAQSVSTTEGNNETLVHQNEELLLHKHCPVSSQMTNTQDFKQWRDIRFTETCAISVYHLYANAKEANVEKNSIYDYEYEQKKKKPVQFACILEALGILPPRVHGTMYCAGCSERYKFSLLPKAPQKSDGGINNNNDKLMICLSRMMERFDRPRNLKFTFDWLMNQIKIGHLLRFDITKKYSDRMTDYEEDDDMSVFWDKLLIRYHQNILLNNSGENQDQDHHRQMTTATCSDVWNMNLTEFAAVFLMNNNKERLDSFNLLVQQLLFGGVASHDEKEAEKRDNQEDKREQEKNRDINTIGQDQKNTARQLVEFVKNELEDFDFSLPSTAAPAVE